MQTLAEKSTYALKITTYAHTDKISFFNLVSGLFEFVILYNPLFRFVKLRFAGIFGVQFLVLCFTGRKTHTVQHYFHTSGSRCL